MALGLAGLGKMFVAYSGQSLASQINAIYAASDPGDWWDDSLLSKMRQDPAGTIPVTALEQTVGWQIGMRGLLTRIQPAAGSRRVVSARKNRFTETEFRNGLADASVVGLVTATTMAGYLGALAFAGDGSTVSVAYKPYAAPFVGALITISVVVQMNDGTAPITNDNPATPAAQVDFGLVIDSGLATASTPVAIGGGRYLISATAAVPRSSSQNYGVVKYGGNSLRGFKVTAYQVVVGSTAGRYQRVNTATDYDSVGFPVFLRDDGVGSGMYTSTNVDLTGTNKASVVGAWRKASDAATGMLLELGATADSGVGKFYLAGPVGAGAANYQVQTGPIGARVYGNYTGFAAPITNVLSVLIDNSQPAANQIVFRADGVVRSVSPTIDGGASGNFASAVLYFGRRGDVSLPFNGAEFASLVIGRTLTASELSIIEAGFAAKSQETVS